MLQGTRLSGPGQADLGRDTYVMVHIGEPSINPSICAHAPRSHLGVYANRAHAIGRVPNPVLPCAAKHLETQP